MANKKGGSSFMKNKDMKDAKAKDVLILAAQILIDSQLKMGIVKEGEAKPVDTFKEVDLAIKQKLNSNEMYIKYLFDSCERVLMGLITELHGQDKKEEIREKAAKK